MDHCINPRELKRQLESGLSIQIIDIREVHERDICSISDIHIPMDQVMNSLDLIRRDIPVVIHCKGGDRAAAVVHLLRTRHGLDNVLNLRGGINAWAQEVDPALPTY